MRENKDLEFAPGYDEVMEGAKSMVAENGAAYATPFGDILPEEFEKILTQGERGKRDEVTLHFGKGLCKFFQSKKGEEMARIKIPNTPFESWPSFVVPARIVHDNQYGKGYWLKLPADARTLLTISRKVTLEDGAEAWQDKRIPVENRQLKELVESYKKTPSEERQNDADSQEWKPRDKSR